MRHLFAYGRLCRALSVESVVVSIHFVNGDTAGKKLCMVMDDVYHWKRLLKAIKEQIAIKEKNAQETGEESEILDLVVIDADRHRHG